MNDTGPGRLHSECAPVFLPLMDPCGKPPAFRHPKPASAMSPAPLHRHTITAAAFAACAATSLADYPIASHRYLADPGALVRKDRVYLYCSNDDDSPVEGGYKMHTIACVSSSDMKNWTDHGVVLRAPEDVKWAGNTWAPSPAEKDGRFYLYFGNGGNGIGVATADSPTGPFRDPIQGKLVSGETPGVQPSEHMWLFDPMTFVDDDGRAYMYFGGNGDDNVRVIRLKSDMIHVDGPAGRFSAKTFFEASWMHKRNGIYYFSYSTNPSNGMRIDYLMSRDPVRGFTYGGVLAPQPPENSNNNHQAVFLYRGVWYEAYHNRSAARHAGIPTGFRRNLAIDTFDYNPDGTIRPVKCTEDGVLQVGHLNPRTKVEAETFASQHGIHTEPCPAGGMNLCDIDNNDWVTIRGADFGAQSPAKFAIRAASARNGGKIEIHIGGPDGPLAGTCPISATGGTANWQTMSTPVSGLHGVQDITLRFTGDGADLFRLDSWIFQ